MLKSLLFILCFPLAILGQNNSNGTALPADWKKLEQATYGIRYPTDWELNQSGQMGSSFILSAPQESVKDPFRENCNLIIQDLSAYDIDLDEYTRISEEQIESLITNSKILVNERVKNSQGEYHHLVYTGDQGVFHLRFTQYYWIVNKNAYVLTFTCESDRVNEYVTIFERIFGSFVLKM